MAYRKIKRLLSDRKRKICELDAESIAYYRRNPCIACEDLLGIRLIDSQKYILQESWNKPHVLWCCSRNFGKSFLGAVFMILKAILYENQAIISYLLLVISLRKHFLKSKILCYGSVKPPLLLIHFKILLKRKLLNHQIIKQVSNIRGCKKFCVYG